MSMLSAFVPSIIEYERLLQKGSSGDVLQFTHDIMRLLCSDFKVVCGTFFIYEHETDLFRPGAFYGVDFKKLQYVQFKIGEGIAGEAALQKRTLHFNNLSAQTYKISLATAEVSITDILLVPLFFKRKTYGVLELNFFTPVSDRVIYEIELLAQRIAISLESNLNQLYMKRLLQKTQDHKLKIEESYSEIKIISEIGQQITSALSSKHLFQVLDEQLVYLMPVEEIDIWLFYSHEGVFGKLPDSRIKRKGERISLDQEDRLEIQAYLKKEAIVQQVAENEPLPNEVSIHSIVALPLMVGQQYIGTLTVKHSNRFMYVDKEVTILKLLSAYLAIAIDNIKAYDLVKSTNHQLTASIKYAQTIQQAILPSVNKLKDHFDDHFILFAPKDMVSGDFFWFAKKGNVRLLAVIDCTGHGVPGAFMSMIGNTLINQIILEKNIDDPAEVLIMLGKGINDSLDQHNNGNRDGMDLTLIKINEEEDGRYEIVFSGAKSKLYHVQNEQVKILKGDNISIGGVQRRAEMKFSSQTFIQEKGNAIYLMTDGWADICNPQRRNFGSKQITQVLTEVCTLSMDIQKEIICERIIEFQDYAQQRDDLTVIGIKP